MTTIYTTSILNIQVSAIVYRDVLHQAERWIRERKRKYICVAATHLLMECQKDKALLAGVNKARLVTPDGMPLVWLLKLYGHKKVERVYGPTLMLKLCRLAEKNGYKIFLLGGSLGESGQLRQKLKNKFSSLQIAGNRDTPVRAIPEKENNAIVKKINSSGAQIVFVGMGCPIQELWMIRNRRRLEAPVLIGVGAAFDFITAKTPQAPPWMQNTGLEWLYRLLHEPKRLAYRYVVLNTRFTVFVLKQLVRDFIK
ncbi:WecB/TagA/CpsF family glycosyltransferase [Candidatus Gottesmanbacteria bacterium]|nr:WecB/TagA/CpsF family glycosyltransferase [Candidatus Gottesmanbacteria bacterium]